MKTIDVRRSRLPWDELHKDIEKRVRRTQRLNYKLDVPAPLPGIIKMTKVQFVDLRGGMDYDVDFNPRKLDLAETEGKIYMTPDNIMEIVVT